MKRKGLTLMELLTVISILATLSALLYPVYLKVRSRIYEVSCANQLKQIGLAIKMYAEEQGDGSPYSMPYDLGLLYPIYVNDKNLLVCPYFQTIAPEVVEEMQRLYPTRFGNTVWSSYTLFVPWMVDEIATKRAPGETESFSEAFALRGDATPIVICEAHRTGCISFMGVNLMLGPKGTAFAQKYCAIGALSNPDAAIVILRWGGHVDLVYKGGLLFPIQGFLLEY